MVRPSLPLAPDSFCPAAARGGQPSAGLFAEGDIHLRALRSRQIDRRTTEPGFGRR